jgi:hypothetical protein
MPVLPKFPVDPADRIDGSVSTYAAARPGCPVSVGRGVFDREADRNPQGVEWGLARV